MRTHDGQHGWKLICDAWLKGIREADNVHSFMLALNWHVHTTASCWDLIRTSEIENHKDLPHENDKCSVLSQFQINNRPFVKSVMFDFRRHNIVINIIKAYFYLNMK